MPKNKYRCPVCGYIAEIDKEEKTVMVFLPPGARTFPQVGHRCELPKAVDQIVLSKLEKLDEPMGDEGSEKEKDKDKGKDKDKEKQE